MNAFHFLMDQTVPRIAWGLLHFVWQGTGIAMLLATVLWLAQIRHPATRYAFCLFAFFAIATCPVVTVIGTRLPSLELNEHQNGHRTNVNDTESDQPEHQARKRTAIGQLVKGNVKDSVNPQVATSKWSWLSNWIVIVWSFGVAMLNLRLVLGWIGLRRIQRDVEPAPDWIMKRLGDWSDRLRVSEPLIHLSHRVTEAVAVGFLRPMILLPVAWAIQLPADMIEAVILHELVHIRRCDLWMNLFQRLVETLLFYHPAVWWLSGRIRIERELCCDELVVRTMRNPIRYAETLERVGRLSLARSLGHSHQSATLTMSIGGPQRFLLKRIRAILGHDPREQTVTAWIAGLFPLIFAILVAGTLVGLYPVAANNHSEESPPPQSGTNKETPSATTVEGSKNPDDSAIDDDLFVVVQKVKSRLLEIEGNIIRVDGHDPAIVHVTAIDPKTLQLRGLAPGFTIMTVTGRDGTEFAMVVQLTDVDSPVRVDAESKPYTPKPRKRLPAFIKIISEQRKSVVFKDFPIVLEFPHQATNIDGFDESIMRVAARTSDQIEVRGLTIGRTTMSVNKGEFTIEIEVKPFEKMREGFRKLFDVSGR